MKILIDGRVLTHIQITGVEKHAQKLIASLDNLKNISIDIAKPRFINKYYAHFWEHLILPIKALSYDILYCPSNIAPIFLSKKIKLVLTLHDLAFIDFADNYSKIFQYYYSKIIPVNLKRANRIITVSNYARKRIVKEYPYTENKIQKIYHGSDIKFPHADKQDTKKSDYILYIGSYNEVKNFQSVIKAFLLLSIDNTIKLKLVMPIIDTFKISHNSVNLIKDIKKDKNIDLLEYMSFEQLKILYERAKVFVFPSYHESFGLPVLEAMACGTPVVCSDVASLPEIGGDAVVYCDPNNVNDIVEKMEMVLSDEKLQQYMIEKGLKRAKQFTWEKAAQEHLKVFEEVLQN